jgi:hypothetical protein
MAHRNTHKSKKLKIQKSAVPVKQAIPPPVSSQPATAAAPLKTTPTKAAAPQEAASVRFAELPYELRRIALFFAFVVVLLIVLWFFLK